MLEINHLVGFGVNGASSGGGGGGSGPTIVYQAAAVDSSNASTYTFSSQPIGPVTSDRLVAVLVSIQHIYSAMLSITSVSVAGTPATQAAQVSTYGTGGATTAIFYVNLPSGATAADIVVGIGGGTARSCGIGVWSMTGQSSFTPTLVNSDSRTSGTITLSSNVALNDALICGATINSNPDRTSTFTGATEDFDAVQEVGYATHHGGSASALAAASPRTITIAMSGVYAAAAAVLAVWH